MPVDCEHAVFDCKPLHLPHPGQVGSQVAHLKQRGTRRCIRVEAMGMGGEGSVPNCRSEAVGFTTMIAPFLHLPHEHNRAHR